MFRKISTLTLVTLIDSIFLASCQSTTPQEEEKVYSYPFDTAKITYEIKGDMEGTKTVFIKGNKSSTEIHKTKNLSGVVQNTDTLTIDTGEYIYQIDLQTKTGNGSKNPVYEQLKALPAAQRANFLTKLAIGMVGNGAKMPAPKEQKEVAGRRCDLYSIANFGDVCLWYGVPLYTMVQIPQAGMATTETATSIELNPDVSDQKFVLPNGIKMQDLSR